MPGMPTQQGDRGHGVLPCPGPAELVLDCLIERVQADGDAGQVVRADRSLGQEVSEPAGTIGYYPDVQATAACQGRHFGEGRVK